MSSNQPDEAAAPEPQYEKSIEFLEQWMPGGPWVLTSIIPDKPEKGRATFTDTFGGGDVKSGRLLRWLEEQGTQRRRNLYWTPNGCRKQTVKEKPKKVDIQGLYALHVDLDPRAGEDRAAERERIFKLLKDPSAKGIPKPSVIVDSGNGGQAFWRLQLPFLIAEATEEAADAAALWNKHLGDLLGGDATHNVDRVMRLPGTVNWPDKRKREKGRVPVLAEVVEFGDERYDLDAFEKAEPVRSAGQGVNGRAAPEPSGVERLDTLDDLPEGVSDDCKVVIAQGCDPDDDPGRFGGAPSMFGLPCGAAWQGDRSKAVWYVACELVRAGADDDMIRAVLLDEGWGISAHVLDQKDPARSADRQIERARNEVGEVEAAAAEGGGDRPVILTNPGRHAEVVDEAERALLGARVPIYQRGPELVRPVVLDRSTAEGGVTRARGATVIQPVTVAWLHDAMSRSARWRYRKDKKLHPDDPMEKHARTLLARAGAWSFPVLRGIVTAPTLREDGSILQVPGYDAASGLIFEPGGATFPPVPEHPTRDEAVAALAMLDPLFAEFPFVDEAARSVVLSAVLSGLVGRVLPAIPMHAFDAPAAGTGKSLLAETVGAIVLGHKPSAMNQGKEEAEDEKRLATALRAGDPIIWIDNAERVIAGDTICSILTQESVLLRILGKSEQVALPCNVLVMATGNNLTLGGDVTRRSLVCRLDAREERPDRREFDFNPKLVAAERRAELVVAGLTVLRAYISAGRPGRLAPVGSFERWSEWVREALVWCGRGDPDETRTAVLDDDPRRAELVEVLEAWRAAWGDSELTVSEVRVADELRDLLIEVTGRPTWNGRSIGKWLKRQVDRVVAGLVLRRAGSRGGVARWRVDAVDGREPVRGSVPEQDDSDAEVIG